MARDDYRKFDELLDLIQDMCRPIGGMSYNDIMERLNCSRKTVERIINFLSERFPDSFEKTSDPINPKIQRFRLDSPDGLPPEYLTDDEMLALNAAVKRIKNETINKPLSSLEYKLNRIIGMKKGVRQMNDLEGAILSRTSVVRPYPHIEIDAEIMHTLQYAVLSGHQVQIKYNSADGDLKKYTLCPVGFLYGNSNNYLLAYKDTVSGNVCEFILSRITSLKIKKDHFNASKFDINSYVSESFGAYHSEHGKYDVVWHVSKNAAPAACRYTFHESQKIIKHNDGSLTIKMKCDGLWEMAWYLFQWRGEIVPIAPQELVNVYSDFLHRATESLKYSK
ncbi:MAG: WYL domain-containing protein [Alphaproteobacteria bacterium]|nr:WYL domain-containing protein [Alphaproteobacteria bacterium]